MSINLLIMGIILIITLANSFILLYLLVKRRTPFENPIQAALKAERKKNGVMSRVFNKIGRKKEEGEEDVGWTFERFLRSL